MERTERADDPRAGRAPAPGDHAHRPPPAAERRLRARRLLDCGPGDDRARRAADPERARRAPSRSNGRPRRGSSRASRRPSWSSARADPDDGRCSLISITPCGERELAAELRNRKDAYLAQRLAGAPRARRRDAAPGRRDPRADARGGAELSAAAKRSFAALQILNYRLYFARPDRLAGRQLDADRRRAVADPAAHRQRRRGRHRDGPAVQRHPPVRRPRRLARRPLRQAPPADRHPDRDGGTGAGDVRPLARRRGEHLASSTR